MKYLKSDLLAVRVLQDAKTRRFFELRPKSREYAFVKNKKGGLSWFLRQGRAQGSAMVAEDVEWMSRTVSRLLTEMGDDFRTATAGWINPVNGAEFRVTVLHHIKPSPETVEWLRLHSAVSRL